MAKKLMDVVKVEGLKVNEVIPFNIVASYILEIFTLFICLGFEGTKLLWIIDICLLQNFSFFAIHITNLLSWIRHHDCLRLLLR